MFPFQGMPKWAQVLGNLLPLTYFNRLIRGIMLKGNGWANSLAERLATHCIHAGSDDGGG